MPVYEYQCQACRHRFERRQSFHDEPVKVCPECGGATKRLLQAPPIIFKGSGWYATDSRPPQPSSAESSSKGESSGSSPSPPSGAEKKDSSSSSGAEKKKKKD
jgi:putative FmdB family regulatory protein